MTHTDMPEPLNGADWAHSPAPERFRPEIDSEYGLFIDGEFKEPRSGKMFDTINPATGERLARIA